MIGKGKRRELQEINAASMADIAFLLLLFFLMTTTIDIDKGITVMLPPKSDEIIEVKIEDRNVLAVVINARDQLLVDEEHIPIKDLKRKAKEFITNPNNAPTLAVSPDSAIISLKNDKGTSYNIYIQVYNELKAAYNELRDEEAKRLYGKPFRELNKEQQALIRSKYPIRISEAEPVDFGQKGAK